MIIKRLHLTSYRGFNDATFDFKPGINVIVGVNGKGKSTTLEALRVCLTQIQPGISVSKNRKEIFPISDIKIGKAFLQVSCDFELDEKEHNLFIFQQRTERIFTQEDIELIGRRYRGEATPDEVSITPALKKSHFAPVGLYYSTRRSLITRKAPAKGVAEGLQSAAFAEALSGDREFNLRIFANWFKAQIAMAKEDPVVLKNVKVLQDAVYRFLPEFSKLDVTEADGDVQFTIVKSDVQLNINQLSDGERGVLALVLDIARRLSLANPEHQDPLSNGKGVVLIDELDLHLHPQWQRSIVSNLIRVFPNCQFIVTTHSPQIIGEVNAENITVIGEEIYQPDSAFGLDSSRVLEEVLDTPARTDKVKVLFEKFNRSIDSEDLPKAKQILAQLKDALGTLDPDVVRCITMITFLEEDLSNEADIKN